MLGPGAGSGLPPLKNIDNQEETPAGDEGTERDRESTTSCRISSEHASKHASVAALFGQTLEGTPFLAARAFSAVTYAPLTSLIPSE